MTDEELQQVDPGVRDLVRWLNEQGFPTSDSGDGVTKFHDGRGESDDGCTLDYPHVFITYRSHQRDLAYTEVQRLSRLLAPYDSTQVGVTLIYSPDDDFWIIELAHFTNADVPKER